MRALMSLQEQILIRLLLMVWLIALTCTASAGQLVDIYRAEVLVTSQSVGARNAAAREAMREVLVRVSGSEAVPEQPEIVSVLSQAHTYLQEFSYASTDKQLEVDGNLVPTTLLILKFSAQGIERLLHEARLPLWPASRPRVLVWLISQDVTGAYSRIADESVLASIQQQAVLRGLPVQFPAQDFEDSIALPSESLWSLDEASIQQASERYKPDAILIGRYSQTEAELWQASWQLLHSAGNHSEGNHSAANPPFEDQAADPLALFPRAVNAVADNFAGLYAIVPRDSGPDVIVMRIGNVKTFSAFKNVQRYLEGLTMVKRLELLEVVGQDQLVRLAIEGDQALLLSTLALGKKLFPAIVEAPVLAPENTPVLDRLDILTSGLPPPLPAPAQGLGSLGSPLVYRWQP